MNKIFNKKKYIKIFLANNYFSSNNIYKNINNKLPK